LKLINIGRSSSVTANDLAKLILSPRFPPESFPTHSRSSARLEVPFFAGFLLDSSTNGGIFYNLRRASTGIASMLVAVLLPVAARRKRERERESERVDPGRISRLIVLG